MQTQTDPEQIGRHIQAARSGNPQAFGELVKMHEPMLRAFALYRAKAYVRRKTKDDDIKEQIRSLAFEHISEESDSEDGDLLVHLNDCRQGLSETNRNLLANRYFYIDSEREADKVLVKQLKANMVTIAKTSKYRSSLTRTSFAPIASSATKTASWPRRILRTTKKTPEKSAPDIK